MKDSPLNIGRYRVENTLGQGSFGVVYLAHDEMIDRKVAIKSIRMDNFKTPDERKLWVDLFFKEARIIGRLHHAHITSIFDMGTQHGNPYLVMEYVTGKTIKQIIDEGVNMPLESILRVISMSARALHYMHQRDILHRDIKPSNIIVMPELSPKITDFGIARFREASREVVSLEQDGRKLVGSPHYMPPERVRQSGLDQRADIFSLGVLAYEWLAGERPFKGAEPWDIVKNILQAEERPLTEVSTIEPELAHIIHRALRKKPDDRFHSAAAFSDALEIYMDTRREHREIKAGTRVGSFTDSQLKTIELLKKNYVFFVDFSREDFFNLFQISSREKFKKDDVIIHENTSGARMYVIIRGEVSVIKDLNGHPVEIKRIGAGGCFGEMAIIDKHPRFASVVALKDTLVIAINEAVLRHSNPNLCLKLYHALSAMICEKLRASNRRYLELLSDMGGVIKKAESAQGWTEPP